MKTTSRGFALSLLLVSSLTIMAGAVATPTLPGIRDAFADAPRIELLSRLVLTIPALAIALSAPVAGWCADNLGRVRTILLGLCLYGLAGTSGSWLPGLLPILGGRFLLGASVSLLMTGATALIADTYQGSERRRFMSWQSASMSMGGVFALLVSGTLAETSWRWSFLLYTAAWVLIPVVWKFVKTTETRIASPSETDEVQPPPPKLAMYGLYAAAFVGMILFYTLPTQTPFFLTEHFGATSSKIGIAMAVMNFSGAVGALSTPRIISMLGQPSTLVAAFAIVAPGLYLLGSATSLETSLLGLGMAGAGFGTLIPNLNLWVANIAPEISRGRALAGAAAAFFLGQFSSPLIASLWLDNGIQIDAFFQQMGGCALILALVIAVVRYFWKNKPNTHWISASRS